MADQTHQAQQFPKITTVYEKAEASYANAEIRAKKMKLHAIAESFLPACYKTGNIMFA